MKGCTRLYLVRSFYIYIYEYICFSCSAFCSAEIIVFISAKSAHKIKMFEWRPTFCCMRFPVHCHLVRYPRGWFCNENAAGTQTHNTIGLGMINISLFYAHTSICLYESLLKWFSGLMCVDGTHTLILCSWQRHSILMGKCELKSRSQSKVRVIVTRLEWAWIVYGGCHLLSRHIWWLIMTRGRILVWCI